MKIKKTKKNKFDCFTFPSINMNVTRKISQKMQNKKKERRKKLHGNGNNVVNVNDGVVHYIHRQANNRKTNSQSHSHKRMSQKRKYKERQIVGQSGRLIGQARRSKLQENE